MTNLNLLKIFVAVAKHKNITKASEELYISQPAISSSIKELEKELDIELFIRKNKGVDLTVFGNKLYNKIKDKIEFFENLDSLALGYKNLNQGLLRIGSHSSNSNTIITECLKLFAKEYPNIKIVMERDTEENLFNKLENNSLDLIFCDESSKTKNYECLFSYNIDYKLIGNEYYYNLFKEGKYSLNNFPIKDLILPSNNNSSRKLINKYFEDKGIKLNQKYELEDYILLYNFVKNGLGIAFVNADYYKKQIENKEVYLLENISINARIFSCLINPENKNIALEKFKEIIKKELIINK